MGLGIASYLRRDGWWLWGMSGRLVGCWVEWGVRVGVGRLRLLGEGLGVLY